MLRVRDAGGLQRAVEGWEKSRPPPCLQTGGPTLRRPPRPVEEGTVTAKACRRAPGTSRYCLRVVAVGVHKGAQVFVELRSGNYAAVP